MVICIVEGNRVNKYELDDMTVREIQELADSEG